MSAAVDLGMSTNVFINNSMNINSISNIHQMQKKRWRKIRS